MSFLESSNAIVNTEYIKCDTIGCKKTRIRDNRFASGLYPGWEINVDDWFALVGSINGKWYHYCPLHRSHSNKDAKPTVYETAEGDFARYENKFFGKPTEVKANEITGTGLQSEITTCFKRLDPKAMLALGRVLAFGENKYEKGKHTKPGQENWRKIPHENHLDHALEHIFNYQREQIYGFEAGDEDAGQHLEHAFCRLMFALAIPPESDK